MLAAERLHGDDTPVPVLAKGKTDQGRLWVYVRDDRPFAGDAPPAALFRYSRDRRGELPKKHLEHWAGILQADAYAGFNDLYDEKRQPRPVTDALCWAHGRRRFFELADLAASRRTRDPPAISPIALEAVQRIDAIFAIERRINGADAAMRLAVRAAEVAPLVRELEAWLRAERARLSRHAAVAKAIDYLLKRWDRFTRFLDDGRICLTNNAAERALRGVAMTRPLYPPSSSVWKHCELALRQDATRATCPPERGRHPFMVEVGGADLVRSARHNLLALEDAVLDQATDAVARDAQHRRGLRHREPVAAPLGGTVGVDAVHASQ